MVAVTSLAPDHLDWHGTVERYYADKLSLCTKPGVELVLANGSDERLRAEAPRMGPHVRWVTDADGDHDAVWSDELGLRGRHNARNATLARQILLALGIPGADDDQTAAPRQPPGSPGCPAAAGRWAPSVRSSSSTTASRPMSSRPRRPSTPSTGSPVALLVGGHDRGVDYAPLGSAVARRTAPTLVVTMPDNGPRIGAAIRADGERRGDRRGQPRGGRGHRLPLGTRAMPAGRPRTQGSSEGEAVVLLSPAAPSFGRFSDYRERAAAFTDAAARCGPLEGGG